MDRLLHPWQGGAFTALERDRRGEHRPASSGSLRRAARSGRGRNAGRGAGRPGGAPAATSGGADRPTRIRWIGPACSPGGRRCRGDD